MDTRLHILQHALGLDAYGAGSRYRNYFCTSPGSCDFADCQALVEQGLMQDHGARTILGGSHLFSVTPEGEAYIARHSPKAPTLTRAQRRYAEYRKVAKFYESFGDWLRNAPQHGSSRT